MYDVMTSRNKMNHLHHMTEVFSYMLHMTCNGVEDEIFIKEVMKMMDVGALLEAMAAIELFNNWLYDVIQEKQ